MTVENSAKTGRHRIQVKRIKVMDHIEEGFPNLDNLSFSQFSGPFAPVHVPSDGNDRSDLPERVKDRRSPDVPGMDKQLDTLDRFDSFRPHMTVGIRNDANETVVAG